MERLEGKVASRVGAFKKMRRSIRAAFAQQEPIAYDVLTSCLREDAWLTKNMSGWKSNFALEEVKAGRERQFLPLLEGNKRRVLTREEIVGLVGFIRERAEHLIGDLRQEGRELRIEVPGELER